MALINLVTLGLQGGTFSKKIDLSAPMKYSPKCSLKLKKPPSQTKSARVNLKDLVTHERKRSNLFRYPNHDIEAYDENNNF